MWGDVGQNCRFEDGDTRRRGGSDDAMRREEGGSVMIIGEKGKSDAKESD